MHKQLFKGIQRFSSECLKFKLRTLSRYTLHNTHPGINNSTKILFIETHNGTSLLICLLIPFHDYNVSVFLFVF